MLGKHWLWREDGSLEGGLVVGVGGLLKEFPSPTSDGDHTFTSAAGG